MKPGDKVTYIPFKGCSPDSYEKGIVKSVTENDFDHVFVVYKCAEDWENYQNYTGQKTHIKDLLEGWV